MHHYHRQDQLSDTTPAVESGSVTEATTALFAQVEQALVLAGVPWECDLEHCVDLPAVRSAVREHLVEVPPEVVEDVVVVVQELTGNAVLHTRSPRRLRVCRETGAVRVEVSDGDPAPPVLHPPSTTRPGGRGILLVHRISRAWGVLPEEDGKTVWAELAEHP